MVLQPKCLDAREGCAYPEVEMGARFDGCSLAQVESMCVSCCVVYLTVVTMGDG